MHASCPPVTRRLVVALAAPWLLLGWHGGHTADDSAGAADPMLQEQPAARMTRARLEMIVAQMATETDGRPGWLRFVYDGVPMACVSDPNADRMRITAPIVEVTDLTAEQLLNAMEANFHSALDARYATSQGLLHAVYLHPLSSLTEAQIRSAVRQIAVAYQTFGTAYTSGLYQFRGSGP